MNDTQLVDKLFKNEHHSSTKPLKREADEDEGLFNIRGYISCFGAETLLSSILEDRTRVGRKFWDIEAEIKKFPEADAKKCAKKCAEKRAEQMWGYERRNYYEPLDEKTAGTIKRNHLYPTFRLARKSALLIKAVGWF